MKKRFISRLEQGDGTSLVSRLFLTPSQRKILLKWVLFVAAFLLLQVLQDVIFSRLTLFGGCPDIVPAFLLLVCLTQDIYAGALFVLLTSVFRCLCGAVLGPVSIAVLVFAGVCLSAVRRASLWGRVRSVLLCCCAGLLIHQLVLFGLGVFLGLTVWERLPAALGGCLGSMVAALPLYPLALSIGKIGGNPWKD